jgi:hypothetical protein
VRGVLYITKWGESNTEICSFDTAGDILREDSVRSHPASIGNQILSLEPLLPVYHCKKNANMPAPRQVFVAVIGTLNVTYSMFMYG